MKIIAVLRNPVERAFSAYNHYRVSFYHRGVHSKRKRRSRQNKDHGVQGDMLYDLLFKERTEFPSLEECIEIELNLINSDEVFPAYEPSILRRGLYADQLERYVSLFGKNVLLIGFRDLIHSTEETLDKIITFVGAKDVGWSFLRKEAKNSKPYSEVLSASQRDFLENYYREPNRVFHDKFGQLNW